MCLGNEWGRAQSCGVSRARVHGSIITRSIFRPQTALHFTYFLFLRQKRAFATASYLDILHSWITVRIFAPLDWSVFMENGEMGSRVSAADDGDFQRIVDRSGRAHISTALHVRNTHNFTTLHEIITHSHSITRSFPQHYT